MAPSTKTPGCFGAASVYSMDSQVCQTCVGFQECGQASLATLEAIQSTIDVRDILARHRAARQRVAHKLSPPAAPIPVQPTPIPVSQPAVIQNAVQRTTASEKVEFPIAPKDQSVLDLLVKQSKKAYEQALVLCKNNKINECRAMLPLQHNPFATTGPAYLRVACDLLLTGGFTKQSLKMAYMDKLKWGESTAYPNVSIAVALFYSFGLITLDGDRFVVHPDLINDNI